MILIIVSAAVSAGSLAGCGGGGGGSSSGPSNPSPTSMPTPVPTGATLTVQLRDVAGAPVEGLVTLGAQRRATTGGSAAFSGVAIGAQSVSAQVNGKNYSQNFVATPGANTVQITINPTTVSATPVSTLPAPPQFGSAN